VKKSDFITALILIIILIASQSISQIQHIKRDNGLAIAINSLNENQVVIQREIQDIQDNYVSFDTLQSVLTDFENYQLEVDNIRNNVNDFNGLWKQLFGYEQKQYNLRGR
jgi:hypothetical protein